MRWCWAASSKTLRPAALGRLTAGLLACVFTLFSVAPASPTGQEMRAQGPASPEVRAGLEQALRAEARPAAAGMEEGIAQTLDRLERVLREEVPQQAPQPLAYGLITPVVRSAWQEIAELASSGRIPPERLPQMTEAVALSLRNFLLQDELLGARSALVALVKAGLPLEAFEEQLKLVPASFGFYGRENALLRWVGEIPDAAWRPILPKLVADLSHPDFRNRHSAEDLLRALVQAWAQREVDLPEELEPAFFFAWKELLDAEAPAYLGSWETRSRVSKAIRWFAKSGSARVAGYLADTLRRATSSMQAGEEAQRREGHRAYRALIGSLLQDPELSPRFDATLREGIRITLGQLGSPGGFPEGAEATLARLVEGSHSATVRGPLTEELNAFASRFEQNRDEESLRAILSTARIWATRHSYTAYLGEGQDWVFYFYRPGQWPFDDFLRRVSPTLKAVSTDALSGLVRPLAGKLSDANELKRWEGQASLASLAGVGLIPDAWVGRVVDLSIENLAGRDELSEAAEETLTYLAGDQSLAMVSRAVRGLLRRWMRAGWWTNRTNPFTLAGHLRTDAERVRLAYELLQDILGRETGRERARGVSAIAEYLGQFKDEALSEIPLVNSLNVALARFPGHFGRRGVGLVLREALLSHPEWLHAPPDASQLERYVRSLPGLWLPPMGGKIPVVLGESDELRRNPPGILEPTRLAEQQVQAILKLRQQGRLGAGYVHQMAVQGRLPDEFKYAAVALILASPYARDWTQPFFEAPWGKVAPLVHDGGVVELGLNPLWTEVRGRTDFLERVAKVYLKDLEVLEGLPETGQIKRSKELGAAELESAERSRLMREEKAYQRLALALHAKLGTAPQQIPDEIRAKLAGHWDDFRAKMDSLLSRYKAKGVVQVPWFLERPRTVEGWGHELRREAPWEPIQEQLIRLEQARGKHPQPLYDRANEILEEVTDAIDRDLGLTSAGMEERVWTLENRYYHSEFWSSTQYEFKIREIQVADSQGGKTPIYFSDHHTAIFYLLLQDPRTLKAAPAVVNFDAHSDYGGIGLSISAADDANWGAYGAYPWHQHGGRPLISDFFWVYPEWYPRDWLGGEKTLAGEPLAQGTVEELPAFQGPVVVSIDFDYFSGLHPAHTATRGEIDHALEKVLRALRGIRSSAEIRMVMVARSPGWSLESDSAYLEERLTASLAALLTGAEPSGAVGMEQAPRAGTEQPQARGWYVQWTFLPARTWREVPSWGMRQIQRVLEDPSVREELFRSLKADPGSVQGVRMIHHEEAYASDDPWYIWKVTFALKDGTERPVAFKLLAPDVGREEKQRVLAANERAYRRFNTLSLPTVPRLLASGESKGAVFQVVDWVPVDYDLKDGALLAEEVIRLWVASSDEPGERFLPGSAELGGVHFLRDAAGLAQVRFLDFDYLWEVPTPADVVRYLMRHSALITDPKQIADGALKALGPEEGRRFLSEAQKQFPQLAGMEEEETRSGAVIPDAAQTGWSVVERSEIPQVLLTQRIRVTGPSQVLEHGPVALLQRGLVPAGLAQRLLTRGFRVEELPEDLTDERLVGEVQAALSEWDAPLLLVVDTRLEETVKRLPAYGRITAVLLDAALARNLNDAHLAAYLVQTARDYPGRFLRLESVMQAGLEQFDAVATQL